MKITNYKEIMLELVNKKQFKLFYLKNKDSYSIKKQGKNARA